MSIEVSASNIKSIAKNLKAALSDYKLDLKHSQSLEILSNAFGYKDWNTLSAKLNGTSQTQSENHLNDEMVAQEGAEAEVQFQESDEEALSPQKQNDTAPDSIFSRALEDSKGKSLGKKSVGDADLVNEKSLVFRSNIAIDLGTANTLVFLHKKGIVIREPTVIVVRKGSQGNLKVLAVGNEAKSMMGRTPGSIQVIRPLREGTITDVDLTTEMIRKIIRYIQGKSSLLKFRPRVILAIPSGSSQVAKRAFKDSVEKAGAREVLLVEKPMAAAIGAGLPVVKARSSMIVDIGAGTTEVAIISMAGIVYSGSARAGGDMMDQSIIRCFKKQHNFLIAETSAEQIKISIGSAFPLKEERSMDVNGRDLLTGKPKTFTVKSDDIRECLADVCEQIIDAIQGALENTPPKLVGDIKKSGLVLTGGGSLLKGMDLLLNDRFGIPVRYAEDPLSCIALGVGAMLDNIDLLKAVTIR